MNKEKAVSILTRFCCVDNSLDVLSSPFEWAGHTYATNGHMLVRIKGFFGFSSNKGPDVAVLPLDSLNRLPKSGGVTITMDQIKKHRDKILCATCKGSGRIDGEPCPACDGDKYEFRRYCFLDAKTVVATRLLAQIALIVGTASYFPGGLGGLQPIPFKFDGAEGFIMPSRDSEHYGQERYVNFMEDALP